MRKAWVYVLECSANHKCYVGSTSDLKGYNTRWARHVWELNIGCHSNEHLQRSWDKYGSECFSFRVIEETTAEHALHKEQFYIDTLNPEYNVCRVTGTTLGIKHPPRSLEARAKLSAARKGKSFGPCKDETKKKISDAQSGEKSHLWGKRGADCHNYGKVKLKGSEAPDSKPIKDQNGVVYGSQHEAARVLGLNLAHINSVVRGHRKSTGGYRFTYV